MTDVVDLGLYVWLNVGMTDFRYLVVLGISIVRFVVRQLKIPPDVLSVRSRPTPPGRGSKKVTLILVLVVVLSVLVSECGLRNLICELMLSLEV